MNLLPMFFTPPTTFRNLAAGRASALPIAADTPLLLFSSLHWLIPLRACSRSAPEEHAAAATTGLTRLGPKSTSNADMPPREILLLLPLPSPSSSLPTSKSHSSTTSNGRMAEMRWTVMPRLLHARTALPPMMGISLYGAPHAALSRRSVTSLDPTWTPSNVYSSIDIDVDDDLLDFFFDGETEAFSPIGMLSQTTTMYPC